MSSESGQTYRGIGVRRPRSDSYLFMVLVAVLLGFAGAAGAIVFRDLVGGFSNRISIGGTERRVDLGGDYVLEERPAPRAFEGRTLAEFDLRKLGGIQVLLIRSRGGKRAIRVPRPEDRIQSGDHLVLAGPSQTVDNLERL